MINSSAFVGVQYSVNLQNTWCNNKDICDLLQDTNICQQELKKSTETLENPKKLQ
jgi:hypothetical protein